MKAPMNDRNSYKVKNRGIHVPDTECSVFIAGVPIQITEEQLLSKLRQKCPNLCFECAYLIKNKKNNRSRGFGFVKLGNSDDKRAFLGFSQKLEINRRIIDIRPAKKLKNQKKEKMSKINKRLFLTGIKSSLSDFELKEFFSQFWDIERCYAIRDIHSEEARGLGFIDFRTDFEANQCLKQKKFNIKGIELMVKPFNPKLNKNPNLQFFETKKTKLKRKNSNQQNPLFVKKKNCNHYYQHEFNYAKKQEFNDLQNFDHFSEDCERQFDIKMLNKEIMRFTEGYESKDFNKMNPWSKNFNISSNQSYFFEEKVPINETETLIQPNFKLNRTNYATAYPYNYYPFHRIELDGPKKQKAAVSEFFNENNNSKCIKWEYLVISKEKRFNDALENYKFSKRNLSLNEKINKTKQLNYFCDS